MLAHLWDELEEREEEKFKKYSREGRQSYREREEREGQIQRGRTSKDAGKGGESHRKIKRHTTGNKDSEDEKLVRREKPWNGDGEVTLARNVSWCSWVDCLLKEHVFDSSFE